MRIDPASDRNLIAAFQKPDAGEMQGASRAGAVSALWMRPRHPAMQLLRAVMRLAGPHAELIRHTERAWASITFTGTRHTIALGFEGLDGVAAGEAGVGAKTRYRQADAPCAVQAATAQTISLRFPEAQWAVTPGQSAVLYRGDVCLGGGVIASAA